MTAISSAFIESVKSLGVNGQTNGANGAPKGEIKVRNICCVGAGYVGMSHRICLIVSNAID